MFDTISVKARWERWCSWNCDLRVINARKKGIFCRTKSIATTPKSHDHMPTTSLWGVTAKWPTRAPKTKLILCPRDPQGYSHISLSLPGRILKEYRYSMGFAKSHSQKCSLHKWAWCGTIKLFFFIFYCIKSDTSDSFVSHFDGHFAYLKTLDFYFKEFSLFSNLYQSKVVVFKSA